MPPLALSERACPNPACSQFGLKGAGNLHRHGNTARGVPRFRCLTCGKTFSATTGSALHGLRHDAERVVAAATEVLFEGASCRAAARDHQVSHQSVMRWVKAARSHPDLLADMEQSRRDALPEVVRRALAHAVDLGHITASEAAATELEIIRGNRGAYRSILERLIEHHGSYWKLVTVVDGEA